MTSQYWRAHSLLKDIAMKGLLISALACSLLGCQVTHNSPELTEANGVQLDNTAQDLAQGYASIFNGKDLSGWTPMIRKGSLEEAQKVFAVENGIIHVFANHPDGYQLDAGKSHTHGMIFSEKTYKNFSFKFQYKWGKKRLNNFGQFQYDAGAFYHVTEEKLWPVGIEYQVRYNHETNLNHTGDLWNLVRKPLTVYEGDERTFKPATQGGKAKEHIRGEHRALPNVPYNALNDGWNQVEMIVMGNQYAVHKLNGQVVNVAIDLPVAAGSIGLQSETAEIYYRNILIKEFAAPLPIEQFIQ